MRAFVDVAARLAAVAVAVGLLAASGGEQPPALGWRLAVPSLTALRAVHAPAALTGAQREGHSPDFEGVQT